VLSALLKRPVRFMLWWKGSNNFASGVDCYRSITQWQ